MDVVSSRPFQHLLWAARDRDGRERYVLAVKATYDLLPDAVTPIVSKSQRPIAVADSYFDEPGRSSLDEAHDVALEKPLVDVVVAGSARAPEGRRVTEIAVRLRVGSVIDKTIQVVGDRRWISGLTGMSPTPPEPFLVMPLTYERAFGGAFVDRDNPQKAAFHTDNLVGVGWYADLPSKQFEGTLLPNLEEPDKPLRVWGDTTATCGTSFVSPAWSSRVRFAGTYDQRWLDERYPLLPRDFDYRFEQTAPTDQQLPTIRGGTPVEIRNVAHDGPLRFCLPPLELPVVFMVKNQPDFSLLGRPDTVVIWTDDRQLTITWRASLPMPFKFHSLRKVVIGEKSKRWLALQRGPKPFYAGLDAFIREERLR